MISEEQHGGLGAPTLAVSPQLLLGGHTGPGGEAVCMTGQGPGVPLDKTVPSSRVQPLWASLGLDRQQEPDGVPDSPRWGRGPVWGHCEACSHRHWPLPCPAPWAHLHQRWQMSQAQRSRSVTPLGFRGPPVISSGVLDVAEVRAPSCTCACDLPDSLVPCGPASSQPDHPRASSTAPQGSCPCHAPARTPFLIPPLADVHSELGKGSPSTRPPTMTLTR